MKNLKIFVFVVSLLSIYCFSAQNKLIEGIVVDESNAPLVGASILEKGTNNGTTTDIDGKFSLKMEDSNNLLQVLYVGYNSQVIKPSFGSKMTIKLKASADVLSEIVVMGGEKRSFKQQVTGYFRNAHHIPNNYIPRPIHIENGSSENYNHFEDNAFKKVTEAPLATMSIDVDRASYSNIRRYINQGQMPQIDAVRTEEMINYFNYDYKAPSTKDKDPFKIYTTYTECPWNNNHTILHVAMKAQELNRDKIPSSNLVFLIDVSGSMSSVNKLPLVIESFKLLINQLNENDVVSIVTYAGSETVVAKGVRGDQKEKLYKAIDDLQAGGSTAGAAGIKSAYAIGQEYFIEGGNNRVILATDGDFNVGASSEGDLVRLIKDKKKTGIYLSILGYGMGNYQESKMQELSQAGNGNHFYIDNIDEAKKSLIKEFGSSVYTVANDVKFQIEFNPEFVASYRVIGYENRQLANEDFNDDTKDAGELGAGHVVTVLYEIIPFGTQSKWHKSVDSLKYSSSKTTVANTSELATLKARYKKTLDDKSILVETPISKKISRLEETNTSIQWSLVVAEFGLLLRDSPYKAEANYGALLQRANTIADDEYKIECVNLIKKANKLGKKGKGETTLVEE